MLKCKIRKTKVGRHEVTFINPVCGHKQVFRNATPFSCQDLKCFKGVPDIDRLIGPENERNRVLFFSKGTG